jgi:acetyltransferase
LGADGVAEARRIFTESHIPVYDTPEAGVRAFMHMVDYKQNQLLLIETPASSLELIAETADVNHIVATALEEEREHLTEPEAKSVLAAYGIPTARTEIALNADDAVDIARKIGFPVALKVVSSDISHKSDVGGVVLDLSTPDEVQSAAVAMLKRVAFLKPNSKIQGFSVQQMIRKPGAHELILGAASDPVFGPIILFGQGGTAVEVVGDRAVGLPPLNMKLAQELVARTRVSKLLGGYRDRPPVLLDEIYHALIQISKLIADVPEIVELDINPLLADEDGVVAVDARIRVIRTVETGAGRFAIRPYPRELEETVDFDARQIVLRPIRPEDEPSHRALLSKLRPEDRRMRFFFHR